MAFWNARGGKGYYIQNKNNRVITYVSKNLSKATRTTFLDAPFSYLLLILNWFLPTGSNASVDVFNIDFEHVFMT